jgi:serine protease AprX
MRRILTILTFIVAVSSAFGAPPPKFDKGLQKKVDDSKKGGSNQGKANGTVRVIIQTTGDPDTTGVTDQVKKNQGKVLGRFRSFPGLVVEMPITAVENASSHSAVAHVSLDANLSTFGLLNLNPSAVDVNRLVTGAPQTWGQYGVDGTGIGVAVIDSGVTESADVATKIDVDFTGSKDPTDAYGHGTHVAGIIAGSGALSSGKFTGEAPGVRISNLRVLDDQGTGYTSSVIQAIEWAIQNRNAIGKDGKPLNIRIINLSLGHTPYESALTDPLTIACRKAVMSGIVVVAAAGNYGKDKNGNTKFGAITSPGTEPSVITVGAFSTFDTLSRADDMVATYSSRGPTIDNLMKPDLDAPGTRIVAPMAPGNTIAQKYPQLIYNANYMRLSGTSMAAPAVAASAALILQKNPGLTPNAVKAILMYTAEHHSGPPMETGAGFLNTLGAVNLAANVNSGAAGSSYWLVNNGLGLSYGDTIGNYRAVWGGTIIWDEHLFGGNSLINFYQKAWSSTIIWGDTIIWDETIIWEDDVSAWNTLVTGSTIIWDSVEALNADDVDPEW